MQHERARGGGGVLFRFARDACRPSSAPKASYSYQNRFCVHPIGRIYCSIPHNTITRSIIIKVFILNSRIIAKTPSMPCHKCGCYVTSKMFSSFTPKKNPRQTHEAPFLSSPNPHHRHLHFGPFTAEVQFCLFLIIHPCPSPQFSKTVGGGRGCGIILNHRINYAIQFCFVLKLPHSTYLFLLPPPPPPPRLSIFGQRPFTRFFQKNILLPRDGKKLSF